MGIIKPIFSKQACKRSKIYKSRLHKKLLIAKGRLSESPATASLHVLLVNAALDVGLPPYSSILTLVPPPVSYPPTHPPRYSFQIANIKYIWKDIMLGTPPE